MTGERENAAGAAEDDEASRREGLLAALKLMRSSLGRSGSIYARPWYLVIGPPGAGKTAALLNSGLQFPLSGETTADSAAGAPTRAFDYRFAEDAVLIDAAGRYATQAGGEAEKAGWRDFLKLLKRHRPRRPLNGVIVMLGLDELVNSTSEERLAQARAIRKRLREIDETLGRRAPVYVVLAKADRLAGFSAFFDDLTPTARGQAWGATLPLPDSGIENADLADRLAQAVERLGERLSGALLARLQGEADPQRRAQIFAFPRQFALLSPLLREMLGEIAAASRLDPPPRLRGVYFTSARQGGPSVDLLAKAVSSRFELDLPALGSGRSGAASFFLVGLFNDVVFREENLVTYDPRDLPGRRRLRKLAGAFAAALVVGLAAFWLFAYFDQQRLLTEAQARLEAHVAASKDIPTREIADSDLARTAHALDLAREGVDNAAAERPLGFLAFDQSAKILSAERDLYDRALDLILLPRVLVGLQEAMQLQKHTPDETNDAKLYLMLGGKTPFDQAFALTAATSLFERLAPGADRQALRQSLKIHVAALLSRPLGAIALDETFVEDARLRTAGPASP